jgi:hypothetical protein
MENFVPSPVKRAKELVDEEMASEQDVAAICALGFEKDLAILALEETVSVFHPGWWAAVAIATTARCWGVFVMMFKFSADNDCPIKDGDVKKAVATLLAWEAAENEESESESESDSEEEEEDDDDKTSETLTKVDEEEEDSEEEEETVGGEEYGEEEEESEDSEDDASSDSTIAALEERYGLKDEVSGHGATSVNNRTEGSTQVWPEEKESGRYMLRAIIGHTSGGLWAVMKRQGVWVSRNGVLCRPGQGKEETEDDDDESENEGTNVTDQETSTQSEDSLRGVRLEFWERM